MFLTRLLETNSTRVQRNVLKRVQERRGKLEAEIRKLDLAVGLLYLLSRATNFPNEQGNLDPLTGVS